MALAIAVCAAASRVARADAPAANAVGEPYETLETVLVTGSNIRRVETETANPIITIDRAAIDRSGKVTLGDLVQDLPVVAGPYTNPRVNVGGGTGASTISLRGLGSQRTLILVDGQRYLYGDANAIPAAAIERIEVLTDGASSVYGSDAIGGVVNFILRDNYQGVEFAANYGISDRDDGARYGYHFVFGQSSDTGHILAGVDYNKFEPVLASNREFSKQAAYYFYGAAHVIVVGQTPGGRIELPPSLQQQFGCKSVTLKALGVISNPPSLDDFRCYTHDDGYDRQGHGNLELTPQERSSAFVVGGYKLTDKVETYLEYFHNKTQSAFQVAPSFLDTAFGTLAISSKSFYNPFGVDYNNNSYFLRSRLIGNGNRVANSSTSADQATAGFKGAIGDSTWQWNAYMNYGHYSQRGHTAGFIDVEELAGGLGPSYRDAAGHVVCGTDPALGGSGPIAGCVPIDIFNVLDPQTVAALDAASGNAFINVAYLERSYVAEANGTAFTLPAGTVQLAVGVSYRERYGQTTQDASFVQGQEFACSVGSGCASQIRGRYDAKEAYAELLVPILKDMPFASALNLTVGDRFSKYSTFGSTNNTKFALEYRPSEDLLLRGTVSAVFRAPTIADLYESFNPAGGGSFDPCWGLIGTNAACVGVPGDGSFHQPPRDDLGYYGTEAGAVTAGTPIGPEHGKSFNWGFVYDPRWSPGLSVSSDLWRVYLDHELDRIDPETVIKLCYEANGGPYCPLISRYPAGDLQGQVARVIAPAGNLGRIDVKGVDLAAHYRLSGMAFGNIAVNFQATYLDRYAVDVQPGLPGDLVRELAGHYDGANFSRWRALASLNWNREALSAAWTSRYVGKFTVGYARLDYGESACQSSSPPGCVLHYGSAVYHNVSAGYTVEPINTRIDAGIDNLLDKQPPLLYRNNSINVTDPSTFDTIGRFYWARVTVKL